MAHEIAKLLLEHAETFIDRQQAVERAMALGMPLYQIEEYLDWLENIRSRQPRRPKHSEHSPEPESSWERKRCQEPK